MMRAAAACAASLIAIGVGGVEAHDGVALPQLSPGGVWKIGERVRCDLRAKVLTRDAATGSEKDPQEISVGSLSADVRREVTLVPPAAADEKIAASAFFEKAGFSGSTSPAATTLATEGKTYAFVLRTSIQERGDIVKAGTAEEKAALTRDRLVDLLLGSGGQVGAREGGKWKLQPLAWRAFAGAYFEVARTECKEVGDTPEALDLECTSEAPDTPGVSETVSLKVLFSDGTNYAKGTRLHVVHTKQTIKDSVTAGAKVESYEIRDCTVEADQTPK
jgi:hypothetical protein